MLIHLSATVQSFSQLVVTKVMYAGVAVYPIAIKVRDDEAIRATIDNQDPALVLTIPKTLLWER